MPPRSSFGLANNSRSRRRLLLLRAAAEREEKHARRLARAAKQASEQDPDDLAAGDQVLVQSTESVGAAVPELVGKLTATEPDPDPVDDNSAAPETLFPGEDEANDFDAAAAIRKLVAGPRPATWVFCGDGPADTAFPDQFAAELRTNFHRPLDVVINTLVPGSPIETVLENLEWQLARFHPDVVNLVIGPAAASAGPGFVQTLGRLVDQLQELGAAVVIHTPTPDGSDDIETRVDQIQDLATRRAIPLVDHADTDNDHDRVDRLCRVLALQRPDSQ